MASSERNHSGQWSVSVVAHHPDGSQVPQGSYAVDQHNLVGSLRNIHSSHSGTPQDSTSQRSGNWKGRDGVTQSIRVHSPEGHEISAHGMLNNTKGHSEPESVEYHRQSALDSHNNRESERVHNAAKEGLPHSGSDAAARKLPSASSPEGVEATRRVTAGEGPVRSTTAMDNYKASTSGSPSDRAGHPNRSFGSRDGHFKD